MSLTPEQYNAKLQAKIKALDIAALMYGPATNIHDQMGQRLFGQGVMGNEQKIGTYSTEEAYYSKRQFKKKGAFKGRGKVKKGDTFENGNPRKSMYFVNGYSGLRKAQGYQANYVNLSYSFTLRNDFDSTLAVDGQTVVAKLKNPLNALKVEGLTKKYGPTLFKHTQKEKDQFAADVTKKITAYFSA